MKKFVSIVLVLISLLSVVASAETVPFLGRWYATAIRYDGATVNPSAMGMSMSLYFQKNGIAKLTMTSDGETNKVTGNWTAKGNRGSIEGEIDFVCSKSQLTLYLEGTEILMGRKKPGSVSINDISRAIVLVSDCDYTGKALKPSVDVVMEDSMLKKNKDYTLEYKNNKSVGRATVVVTGKGKYKGKINGYFDINPKGTKLKSLSSGKNSVTVKWTKQTKQTTGYEIEYSKSKSFNASKTKRINKANTDSVKLKSLKSGQKYYVRLRTYKYVEGIYYYSSWSGIKGVTVK